MRRKGSTLLALRVPGLAERRPSLVRGDFVSAMLASQSENGTCAVYQVSFADYFLKIKRPKKKKKERKELLVLQRWQFGITEGQSPANHNG